MDFTAGRVIASQQLERMSKAIPHTFGIVTGGVVSISSGVTVAISDVAARDYVINGTVQTTAYSASTLALDAADATNPRIDSVYIDTSGTVGKVSGTPAATPKPPDINETTQLLLANVYVAANDTTLASGDIEDKRQLILPVASLLEPRQGGGTATLVSGDSGWPGVSVGSSSASGSCNFVWRAPAGFGGFRKALVGFQTDATGVARFSLTTQISAAGEASNLATDSISEESVNVTSDVQAEWDIITGVDGVAAGDWVALTVIRNGAAASDTVSSVWLYGVYLEWF